MVAKVPFKHSKRVPESLFAIFRVLQNPDRIGESQHTILEIPDFNPHEARFNIDVELGLRRIVRRPLFCN